MSQISTISWVAGNGATLFTGPLSDWQEIHETASAHALANVTPFEQELIREVGRRRIPPAPSLPHGNVPPGKV